MTFDPRHKSRTLLEGPDRAPSRPMLEAIGFTDEDLARLLVGVAHCWMEVTPCNFNHRKLAEKVKEGVRAAGRDAHRVQHDHGHRRDRHGDGGDESLPDQPGERGRHRGAGQSLG